jgi:26S proteasome regulatory subunit N1
MTFPNSCVPFLPPPDDVSFLRTAHEIYVRQKKYPEALALAIRLGDRELIKVDFQAPANPYVLYAISVMSQTNIFLELVVPCDINSLLCWPAHKYP